MKWSKWLEQWEMTSLKINVKFLEMEWAPKDEDKAAAWDLYVELITRIATQKLNSDQGNEATALESIHALFPLTRSVMKTNTRHCIEFAKIAVVVLNQVIRPFTAKWHRLQLDGAFSIPDQRQEFRLELFSLQTELDKYVRMLADMAGIEDISKLDAEHLS